MSEFVLVAVLGFLIVIPFGVCFIFWFMKKYSKEIGEKISKNLEKK